MSLIIKTRSKAEADEQQRRYFWGLTPYDRLALAVRLNQQAQAIYAANPANPPRNTPLIDGRRVLKSATPVPRGER